MRAAKNDALLELFYEFIGEKYITEKPYAVRILYGSYDIPLKAKDKENPWDSEEVYKFIICTFCPLIICVIYIMAGLIIPEKNDQHP